MLQIITPCNYYLVIKCKNTFRLQLSDIQPMHTLYMLHLFEYTSLNIYLLVCTSYI